MQAILPLITSDQWLGSGFYDLDVLKRHDDVTIPKIQKGRVTQSADLIEKQYVIKVRYLRKRKSIHQLSLQQGRKTSDRLITSK